MFDDYSLENTNPQIPHTMDDQVQPPQNITEDTREDWLQHLQPDLSQVFKEIDIVDTSRSDWHSTKYLPTNEVLLELESPLNQSSDHRDNTEVNLNPDSELEDDPHPHSQPESPKPPPRPPDSGSLYKGNHPVPLGTNLTAYLAVEWHIRIELTLLHTITVGNLLL